MSKFKDAYSEKMETYVTAKQLMHIRLSAPAIYYRDYDGKLLCPACKKARLALVQKEVPFLRAYPNAVHQDDCELIQKEMDALEAKNIAENFVENQDEIIRQMYRLFSRLVSDEGLPQTVLLKHFPSKPQNDNRCGRSLRQNYLPRKNIATAIRPEDENTYKLFYGRVLISWENTKTGGKKLLIRDPVTHKFLCRIFVSKNVLPYCNSEMFDISPYICCLVFLGCLKREEGKPYCSAVLSRSEYMKLSPLKDTHTP